MDFLFILLSLYFIVDVGYIHHKTLITSRKTLDYFSLMGAFTLARDIQCSLIHSGVTHYPSVGYRYPLCILRTKRKREYNFIPKGVTNELTPWLLEPEGSMPHSQGLSNNPYPEPNQPNSS
jgi:hypothetical protein